MADGASFARSARAWAAIALIAFTSLAGSARAQVTASSSATSGTTCTATRFDILNSKPPTNDLGCTANEFTVITNVQQPAGGIASCTAGSSIIVSVVANLSGTNAFRNDGGIYFGEGGNDPEIHGGTCSTARFPLTSTGSGFTNSDGDQCGDYFAAGVENWQINNVHVLCAANPTTGTLDIPYLITWKQPGSNTVCTSDTDNNLIPGTTSKCQTGTATLSTSVGAPVVVRGWVKVTKATSPNAMPDTFSFTASGPAGSNVSPTGFTLTNGSTQEVDIDLATAARTLTITEQALGGWDPTASITCTNPTGGSAAAYVTTNNATRTITANLDPTNFGANCTITNFQTRVRTVKALSPTNPGGAFNLSAQTDVGTASVSDVGNGGATAYEPWTSGAATISETAGTGTTLANYTTTVACVDDTNGGTPVTFTPTDLTGSTRSGTLTPALHHDTTCTITNTRKSATLKLAKAWAANAIANDQANIGPTTGLTNNTSSFSAVAPSAGSSNTVTVYAGETATLPAETMSPGTLSNYTTALSCSAGSLSGTNGQAGNTLAINPADAGATIVCTYTNTRNTHTLTVVKSLAPVGDSGTFVMNANGTTGAAGGNGATASATVNVGDVVSASEAGAGGTNLASYISTISCPGATVTPGAANQSGTFTMPNADVTCTITNTRKTHTLTVVKSLSPGADPGTFIMNANGTTGAASGNGATASATVSVGATVNFSEAAGSGATNLANYTTTWSCNTAPATTGSGTSGSLTMPDADVTCTITNTRKSHNVTVTKSLSPVGDPGKFDLQVNAATVKTDASNGDSGTATNIAVGSTVSIAELAGTGTSLANYTTSAIACTGVTAPAGTTSGSFTMPDNDVSCTFTNTRKSHNVTVTKSLSPAGDPGKFDLQVNATTVKIDASNGDSGTASGVIVGSTVSIAELAGTGTNLANYTTSAIACTGVAAPAGTTSGSFTMPDNDVSCTFTNTRKTQNVTVTKSLSPAGDTGKFDLQVNATTVKTDASNGDSGTANSIAVGSTVSIAELAGTGTNLANYTTGAITCTGVTAPAGTTSGSFTMPDNSVSCTFTNTRKSHTVTVTKSLAPAGDPGKFDLQVNAATVKTDASNGDSGTANSIAVGSTVSIAELAGTGTNLANYTTGAITCTGVTAPAGTTSGSFTMPDNNVSCTFTNTRKTQNVTVTKSLSPVGDPGKFDLQVNAATVKTDASNGDSGTANSIAVGSTVSIAELAGTGTSLANYTTSAIACTGVTAPAGTTSGSFTMPDNNVSCTFTNTRKSHNVTVTKSLSPAGDPGKFDLQVNAATVKTDASNGDSGTANSVAVGSTVSIAELAGTGTSLANYTTSAIACTGVTAPVGTTSGSFTMPDNDVSCTFTNTRKSHNVTVTKALSPAGDPGKFNLQVNAAMVKTDASNGDSGTANSVAVGSAVSIAELAGTGTSLANYTTSAITCTGVAAPAGTTSGSFAMPDNDVSCTFNNTRIQADLSILKSQASPNPALPGQPVTWTITVTNGGPADATSVTTSDTVPGSVTGLSVGGTDGGSCTVTAPDVNCNFGTVPNGATKTYTITGTLAPNATGTLDNTATVQSTTSDPDNTNNSSNSSTPITNAADIALTKTVDNATPNDGDTVTFTITAKNNGPSDATGVEVTDSLPAGLAFTGATPSQGSYDSSTGKWTIGALANGASVTLTLTATVNTTGSVTNTATVTHSDLFDPNTSNNSASALLNAAPSADVQVQKTVNNATPNVGSNVTFTITVHNAGPDGATGVVVNDQLPAGLTFVSALPSQGAYNSGTGDWTIGSMANGATVTLQITATVTQAGSIMNTATKTAENENDPNNTNDTSGVTLNGQQADIQVVKTVDDATPALGDTVTFTITVTNLGPSTATNVAVTDTLSSGLNFVSANPSQGAYNSGTGAWTIGTLPSTAAVTLTITATATQGGAQSNTATKTSEDQPDPNGNNDTTTVPLTVIAADLSITKTDGVTTIVPGNPDTYTITVKNNGPSDVTGATVIDVLAPGLINATWTCTPSAGASCTGGGTGDINDAAVSIPNGGNVVYTVTGTVNPAQTGSLSNTATVTSPPGTPDPDTSNNTATDTDTLTPQADLSITKDDGVSTAVPGGQVTYTITAKNNGPSDVIGAKITDTFPGTVTAANWTASGTGSASGFATSGSGDINDTADMPAGSSVTYTVTATIDPTATGTLTNVADITAPAGVTDPTPGNNSAGDTDTLTPQADLSITKTDNTNTVSAGGTVTYTIVAKNNGLSAVTGASVSDTFPAMLTGVSWTCVGAGGGTCNGGPVAGNINDTVNLPVGATATYTATATLNPAATGTLSNTATVTPPGGVTDPVPGNNSATDTDTIAQPADLSIVKSGPASVIAGQNIVYTITVTNIGPADAANVVVSDVTPPGLTFVSNSGACTTAYPCALGALTFGQLVTITSTYTVSSAAAPASTITNTAVVSSANDPNSNNDSSTANTTVSASADLTVKKTANPLGTYLPGQSLSYTITVTNNGPSDVVGASVSDSVPAAVNVTSWICTPSGTGADCDNAQPGTGASGTTNAIALNNVNLPAGTSLTITVNGTVQLSATGPITNTATVTPPPNVGCSSPPCNQTSTVTNNDSGTPQLSVAKTATPGAFAVGQPGSYSITVSNSGSSSTNAAITVTDPMPAGITMTATPSGSGWNCSASTTTQLSCTTNAVLLPGANAPIITAPVAVGIGAANPSTNTASATGGGDDTCPAPHCSGSVQTPVDAPKLDLTKTLQGNLVVGVQSNYLLSVTNNGTAATIAGGTITDTIPTGLTIGALPGGCSNPSGQLVDCSVPAGLAPGSSVSYTIPVTPQASTNGTNVSNTATVSGGGDPTCPAAPHCTSTVPSPVSAPQLSLTKSATPAAFTVGQQAVYTLTLTNTGTAATTAAATITDTIPSGLTIGTLPGNCVLNPPASQTVVCTVAAPLATNAPVAIDIPVTPQNALNGLSVTNTASATGGGDPGCTTGTPANSLPSRCVGTSTDPVNAPHLVLTKTANPAAFAVGAPASYVLAIQNTGTAATSGAITITDLVPASLTLGSMPAGCTNAGQQVTCTIATSLASNGSASFTIPVTPTAAAAPSVSNTASVQGGGDPTCPATNNCTSTIGTPVSAPALQLSKTSNGPWTVGQNGAAYTLTVSNNGTAATSGAITISDLVPASLTLGTMPAGCSNVAQQVTCTISTSLAIGGSTNFTIVVTPTAAAVPSVSNTATVSGGGDPTCPNAASCTSVSVTPVSAQPLPQLLLVKTASASTFTVGVPASYTLTVTNNGTGPTTAPATITDIVPASLALGAMPNGCNAAGQTVTCTVAAGLGVNASTSYAIPVTPTATGSVTNTASVTGGGDPSCPTASNCTSTTVNPVVAPLLQITKLANGPWTVNQPNAAYTLTVTNSGTAATTAPATVRDDIPAGLTIGTLPNDCSAAGQALTCTIAAGLGINATAVFVIPVVPTVAVAGTSVTNTASVGGGGDPNCPDTSAPPPNALLPAAQQNCTSTVTTPVTSVATSADLHIVKTGPASVMAGANIVYAITVTNVGPDPAVNAVLSDPAPAGLTFVSASGACTAFPCSLGTLAPNQSVTVGTVIFHVAANYVGASVVNVASVTSDTPDPTPNNNSSTVSTPVVVAAKPVATPIDARWMLLAMLLLLAGAGAHAVRTRRD